MQRGGYVKLWRKTLDSGLLGHPFAFTLFGYLLLSCVREKWRYTTRYAVIDLEPGEWIIGRKRLSKELGMSEQNLRTALRLLADMKILTIKSTNEYSTIRLINYAKYQAMQNDLTNDLTNSQPTANQQLTTKKEVREVREVEEKNISDFDQFWAIWPNKTGKQPAEKEWERLTAEERTSALKAIPVHISERAKLKSASKFVPDWRHPRTWLHQRAWEDQFQQSREDSNKIDADLVRHLGLGSFIKRV